MNIETKDLIDSYFDWLKSKTQCRSFGSFSEITTPFLDRHNDYLQIYMSSNEQEILLTDNGYTLSDLAMSGCSIDTEKRKKILHRVLRGFGVSINSQDELFITSSVKNFAQHKHSLIQAMLAVGDIFFTVNPSQQNFFFEEVSDWFTSINARFSDRISFVGQSGLTNQFDFLIPKSDKEPERIIKTINSASLNNIKLVAFAWNDIQLTRQDDTMGLVIMNDYENPIPPEVTGALNHYGMIPISWSQKEEAKELLAA